MINLPKSRTNITITPYATVDPPRTGDLKEWVQREFRKIEASISALNTASVQVAYAAPPLPVNGMLRVAQGGWNPTGLSGYNPLIGQLVIYVNGNWVAASSI